MYKIYSQQDGTTEILLYSLIEGGYTASKLIRQLKDSPSQSITLRINSDGGEVFDAIALYNYLKGRDVRVIIDGICASAASIVAMSGRDITMMQGSMMMIHNPATIAIGDAEELRAQAEVLDKVSALVTDIYASRASIGRDEIVKLMDDDTWMTAPEALAYGFADALDEAIEEIPEADSPEAKAAMVKDLAAYDAAYDDGVKAERARLRELDELSAPGREVIINEAKYIAPQTAQEIAVKLLKNERPQARGNVNLNSLPLPPKEESGISAMADIIMRRRAHGRI